MDESLRKALHKAMNYVLRLFYVHKDAARQRAKQLEVSKVRVLLTDRVANEGRRRPDPSVIAAQMRAAKARARTSA